MTTRPRLRIFLAAFTCGFCCISTAGAAEVYFTYVPVTSVEPITEARRTPVGYEECTFEASPDQLDQDRTRAGDVRDTDPELGIGDLIRKDSRLLKSRDAVRRCRQVTRYEVRDEVVAYRVTYRYKNETYVQTMDEHPGDRIRLKIRVEPVRQWRAGSDPRSFWRSN